MSGMNRRVQILMDERRYELLEREARRTGRSVGELVRDSVDRAYGLDRTARRAALDVLIAEEPMPVDDWSIMKQEMLDSIGER